jgi:PAS domain-containing protein
MFKLAVISGPNQGTVYTLSPGETSIGRQEGNTIVLPSSKISKKHCSFSVSLTEPTEVTVKDEGSSNGIFVNGGLTKLKKLKPGDRVSVGEYVLELAQVRSAPPKRQAPRAAPRNPSQFTNQFGGIPGVTPQMASQPVVDLGGGGVNANTPPQDFKDKVFWYIDKYIMPAFYGMTMRSEWRMVCMGFATILIMGNIGLAVYPLMQSNRATVVKETIVRAQFMARQIAEKNAAFLAQGAETKAEIGFDDRVDGVRVARLTDLDNRIIAPGAQLNQYLTSGPEATFALRARNYFREGREEGIAEEVDDSTVVAIEPVKILNPALGKNVVAAMAIVSIDTTLSTPGAGDIGIVYFETLILNGLFAIIIFGILYKITLKPFLVLNEDMDRALKGDLAQITHEYQIEELHSLWEIINSAIQRIQRAAESSRGSLSMGVGLGSNSASMEEFDGPLKMLAGIAKFGFVILDAEKKIVHMNPVFEEMSGIRVDGSVGQDIGSVARDQSLSPFVEDLISRAQLGGEGVSEDYDFSGVGCKVHFAAFGSPSQGVKCYIMAAVRSE